MLVLLVDRTSGYRSISTGVATLRAVSDRTAETPSTWWVEAQSRVGGRPGAADGQVDTRVLVRTDKWYGSENAWPMWSFVTRAYAGAIDRDLSLDTTNAEISTDVSNVQLGGV